MDLERLPFGGQEFVYDTHPGLGSTFAIGNRDISELQPVDTNNREHLAKPPAPPAQAATLTTSAGATSDNAVDLQHVSTTLPAPDKPAEQFISLPDSPKASAAVVSPPPARPSSRTNAHDAGEPSTSGQDLPWNQASAYINSPLLRLHTEIVEFCRFLEPTADEAAAREAATQRVRQAIVELYANASVQVFGSFVTGLYLPTSDIDLVVLNSGAGDVVTALRALSSKLSRAGLARNIQVVAKAKVPIIKFVEVQSNIDFDISFDVANGPVAAGFVRDLMDSLPPMKPLVLVLKIFLQQRSLNEVYQGGIGSYALFTMVAAFLLLHPSRHPHGSSHRAGDLEPSLGVLLADFFRLFGRSLNIEEVGISCSHGGSFYNKLDAEKEQPQKLWMLSVEDPADAANDLTRGSWNINMIKQAWDFAYQQLTAPSDPSESLLERIIRVDTVLTDRPRPQDPAVPEQLEEQVKDEVHRRSEHSSSHEKNRSRRDRDRTRDRDRDRDRYRVKDRVSKHKSKRRHRERSAEYVDDDEPAVAAVAAEEEDRGHRSSKHDDGRSRRSSDGDQHASRSRRRERKHRKSDRHRSSREVSPSDARRSKHIRFD